MYLLIKIIILFLSHFAFHKYQQSMDMSNYNPCKTLVDLITASHDVKSWIYKVLWGPAVYGRVAEILRRGRSIRSSRNDLMTLLNLLVQKMHAFRLFQLGVGNKRRADSFPASCCTFHLKKLISIFFAIPVMEFFCILQLSDHQKYVYSYYIFRTHYKYSFS